MTLGYELACRTAIAQHANTLDYHTSGSWVAVAVAGVAARMMGLTRGVNRQCDGHCRIPWPAQPNDALHGPSDHGQRWLRLGRYVRGLGRAHSQGGLYRRPCPDAANRVLAKSWRWLADLAAIFQALPRLPLSTGADCGGSRFESSSQVLQSRRRKSAYSLLP